jgi:guanyl-specific ribonuclease Sa
MKRIVIIALVIAAAGFSAAGVAAERNAKDDQYYPELQNDADMRVNQSDKNMVSSGVTYGAWITPVIIYQETPQNTLATSVTTFRLWFKTYLWDNSYLYVRGKDVYTAIISHQGQTKVKNKNILDLDLGYIAAATRRKDVDFAVGRKYFIIGSGLVIDGRGDGAEFNYYSKYINIKALGTWTGWMVKDDNPYGLSDRDISTGAKRVFAGGSLSTSWFNQTLYAFGLAQFDFGKEYYNRNKMYLSALVSPPFDVGFRYYGQKSRYESQYYGAGLTGVIVSGLEYSGEFILEQGKSYLTGYTLKKDIVAYAGQFKLNYYIDVLLKPVVMAHYAFGSGDINRRDYRNPCGNGWGKDRGFLYFGTFVGGYALKPMLANLHMISGSVAFSPFSWTKIYSLNKMTITAKYIYYLKYKTASPINYGLDATRPNRHIGQGVDLSLRWLIFSDFSFFVNYGLFVPGKAFGYYYDYMLGTVTYSSKSNRHFLMGGFNITF